MKTNARQAERRAFQKGVLSIEASISYSIFLMIIVSLLYIIRIVYAWGLVQHAAAQTAKELSMYTYLYQVSGLGEIGEEIRGATGGRTEQFNKDVGNVISMYETLQGGSLDIGTQLNEVTKSPAEILKNMGAALLGKASGELNQKAFELLAKPMMAGYIAVDDKAGSADERLKALRIAGGLDGLDLSSSSFFEDGTTIDLVVCYTIDPVMPIDLLPSMHVMSRACVRGMGGKNAFSSGSGQKKAESVWDMENDLKRGEAIQEQEEVRNLPKGFKTFSAFDRDSGRATAERSVDLREESYRDEKNITGAIRKKCNDMINYRDHTYGGITLKRDDIRSMELILYIPASTKDRDIDRSAFDEAVRKVKGDYPEISIVVKELK